MSNLKKIERKDLDMLLEWRNREDVRLNFFHHQIITKAEHYDWFEKLAKDKSKEVLIYYQDNQALGLVSFSKLSFAKQENQTEEILTNRTAEWGFYSGEPEIKGIGTKMALAAFEYAFKKLDLDFIDSQVLEFNQKSINYHLKLGFEITNIEKNAYQRDKKFYDIYHLKLSKQKYFSMTAHMD